MNTQAKKTYLAPAMRTYQLDLTTSLMDVSLTQGSNAKSSNDWITSEDEELSKGRRGGLDDSDGGSLW